MRNRRTRLLAVVAGLLAAGNAAAADLATLFTTPEERQIINSNRYKGDEVEAPRPVQAEAEAPVQQLVREQVTRNYQVSGITVSPVGAHTVWINSKLYEDGAELEDGSKVLVMVDNDIRVRITAPDGKHYYATSGQALQISYLVNVGN